jgi:hypothetical protein
MMGLLCCSVPLLLASMLCSAGSSLCACTASQPVAQWHTLPACSTCYHHTLPLHPHMTLTTPSPPPCPPPQLKDEVADPECRQVAERAYKTLFQVGGEGLVKPLAKADATKLCEYLTSFAKANGATKVDPACLQYVAHLCASLCDTKNLEFDEWSAKAVVPYLVSGCTEEQAQAICRCAALRAASCLVLLLCCCLVLLLCCCCGMPA